MNNDSGIRDYLGIRKALGGQSLGELEAQILDIVWDLQPPVTTSKVFKIMYPRRELSYSTIMLTMSKLAKKGFLKQRRSGVKKTDAFLYTPTMSREELAMRLLEGISRRILRKPFVEAVKYLMR